MICRLEAGGSNMKYVGNNEAACKHRTQVTERGWEIPPGETEVGGGGGGKGPSSYQICQH